METSFFRRIGLVLFVLIPSLLSAIEPLPTAAMTKLRPGDLIRIRVANNRGALEFDQEFMVNESGDIDLPVWGLFKASGQRIPELANSLTRVLSEKAFKKPQVQVSAVKLITSDKIFLFGGVKNPGPIEFRDSLSVMDAIKMAGGFEDPGVAGQLGGLSEQSTLLFESRGHQSAFANSTSFDYLEKTKLKRGGKETQINIKKLIKEGDVSQNVLLLNNDILLIPRRSDMVPKEEETFYILGAVNNPARYIYRENLSVLDALTLAGGIWTPSNLKYASIIRGIKPGIDAKSQKPEIIRVDLRNLFFRGNLADNKILKPGDILLVSTRQNRNLLSDLGQFIDNFLPFMNRMNQIVGYDDSIRNFNNRFFHNNISPNR